MKSILDKDFIYRKAVETDILETFKRVRERQEKEAKERAEAAKNVQQIKPRIRSK